MERLLGFNQFINEGMFGGTDLFYIFIPLDKNFKCQYSDITNSKTELPSQRDNTGTAGYLLVPSTIETLHFNVQELPKPYGDVTGTIKHTRKSDDDGLLLMNAPSDFDPTKIGSTGVKTVYADVPGYLQNEGIYLKSGDALLLEFLLRRFDGFEEIPVSEIDERVSNGFQSNTAVKLSFEDLREAGTEMRSWLAAASDDSLGLEIAINRRNRKKYDTSKELLELFKNEGAKFMSFNFSTEKIAEMIELAKESVQEEEGAEDIVQTLDNLSDLKASGFFDD